MLILLKIRKIFLTQFMNMRWQSVLTALAIYISVSWILLRLCGENELTGTTSFLYWIMVTASTVGYGDLSPVTIPGRIVVALFVIPFGLGLFGLVIGRIATVVSHQWRSGVKGLKSLNYENHILVLGWNEGRTLDLIELLLREVDYMKEKPRIALGVCADIENPFPDRIGFAKVSNFKDDADMLRTGIDRAKCIIIDNPDDDLTLATALYCNSKNPSGHIIAYFKDPRLGELLGTHCPNVECMPSVAVEMMAKSAFDPGSSLLHHELLDVHKGMTQYSVVYPGPESTPVKSIFLSLKEAYSATLIGISVDGCQSIVVNPALDRQITPGSTLYYIADERIEDIEWSAMGV